MVENYFSLEKKKNVCDGTNSDSYNYVLNLLKFQIRENCFL